MVLARFPNIPSTEAMGIMRVLLPRGLLLLLCVTRAWLSERTSEGNYFARVKSARVSPKD